MKERKPTVKIKRSPLDHRRLQRPPARLPPSFCTQVIDAPGIEDVVNVEGQFEFGCSGRSRERLGDRRGTGCSEPSQGHVYQCLVGEALMSPPLPSHVFQFVLQQLVCLLLV